MRNPFVSIILLLLSGAIYYAFIGSDLQKIQQIQDQSTAADHTIMEGNQLKGLTANIDDKVQRMSNDPSTERVRAVLPLILDPILVLNDVDTIIKNHGMKPKALVLDGAATSQGSAPLPTKPLPKQATSGSVTNPILHTVSFTVSATYPQFVKLLADLQQSLEMVEITSVTFASPVAADSSKGGSSSGASATSGSSGSNGAAGSVPGAFDYTVTLTTVAFK
ncbi:MAG: hypothetical protein ACYC8S_01940 [Minisyncoccota bacterium]